MRSNLIDKRLRYLEQLFVDLKEIQDDINISIDPALKMEYEVDKEVLFDDLEEQAFNVLYLLEAYFEDCKEHNLPTDLEYFKIYRELTNARRLKILSME